MTKKTREELDKEIRFLQDTYWESLDDLDEATWRLIIEGGWTMEEWLAATEVGW